MPKMCERPGCSNPGEAAYGMIAEELLFWLAPLDASAERAGVLCRRHADAMVVPRGWTLDDQRNGGPRLFQAERFANQQAAPAATRTRNRPARTGEQLQIDGTGEIPRPALPPESSPVVEEITVIHGAPDARPTVVRASEAAVAATPPPRVEPPVETEPEPEGVDVASGERPVAPIEAAAIEPEAVEDHPVVAPDAVEADSATGSEGAEAETASSETATEPDAVATDDAAEADPEPPVPEAPWVPHFDIDDDLNGMLDVRSPLLSRAFRGRDRR